MRRLWKTPGGIYPPANKAQSTREPIVPAGLPDQLLLPLTQGKHGLELAPCVEPGQRVLKGEMIARRADARALPLHAPTSGTIEALEARAAPLPGRTSTRCLILRPDGEERWIDRVSHPAWSTLAPEQLIALIHDAGIAGLGGAGFPTATKLAASAAEPITTLIINGAECEPYISADDMLMRERSAEIAAGIAILQQIIGPAGATLIAVEDDKPEAIAALQAALAAGNINAEVVAIPTKYPSGGERQLVQLLTGREVLSGALPVDVGVHCQNIATARAIYRAVELGEPLISRITTVTGGACSQPRNYEVLIGTPISHLLALSGFDAAICEQLLTGGPMMGYRLRTADEPIVKSSNCVVAATAAELPPVAALPCIRCGLCAEACPASLLPQQLHWFARAGDHEKLQSHHLVDCIECGACDYVCPSSIPLVQKFIGAKAEIVRRQEERAFADRARQRFEARQARIAREAADREMRRQKRLTNAQAPRQASAAASKPDAIQAAIERARARKAHATDEALHSETQARASAPDETRP